MLEAKGRNEGVEKYNIVPRGYQFAAERSGREAGLRANASKAINSNATKAGHFTYRPAPIFSSRYC